MAWDVEATDEWKEWFLDLDEDARRAVSAAVDMLEENGPNQGRPVVGQVKGSKHHNLKEIRATSKGRHLRTLFLFDPRSTAIMLVGGDKTGEWNEWYAEAIPVAEALYEKYLAELRREGLLE